MFFISKTERKKNCFFYFSFENKKTKIKNKNSYQTCPKLFTCSSLFQNFQKVCLSLRPIQIQSQDFCHFCSNLSQGFCHLAPVRPFYPSFFSYFHFSCIFHALKGWISNLWDFGVFGVFNAFFQIWSMGFYYGIIWN